MKNKIPRGMYCYDENGICPYWSRRNGKPYQEDGYCSYMEMGDWEADHFFSLLWDQVKECDINDDWDVE